MLAVDVTVTAFARVVDWCGCQDERMGRRFRDGSGAWRGLSLVVDHVVDDDQDA